VTVFVLLAPATNGATVGTVVKAPYQGSYFTTGAAENHNGCGKAQLLRLPYWSASAGIGGFAERSSATACPQKVPGIGSTSYAGFSESLGVNIPISFGTSGNHTITVNWTARLSMITSAVTPGKCRIPAPPPPNTYSTSFCSETTLIDVSAFSNLHDITNGSYVYTNNYWYGLYYYSSLYNQSNCYGSSCRWYNNSYGSYANFTGNVTWSYVFNAFGYQSINSSHRYEVRMSLNGWGYSNIYGSPFGYTYAKDSAYLNIGTRGFGWVISSITIT
jgi:hypothetical protein